MKLIPGIYKHYSGKEYEVLFLAKNANNGDKNLEDLVYQMQSTVDLETAKTTVAVAAETSRYVNNDNANTDKKNNSVPNVENKHFYVSGKEFMEVLAPYADDVLEAWRDGR